MKNLKIMILSVLLACILISCRQVPSDSTTDENEVGLVANDVTVQNEANVETSITEDVDWKNLYYEYLAQSDDYDYSFFKNFEYTPYALAYINDDDIPEIIAYGNFHASGTKVFTIISNEVVENTFGSHVEYIERENLLHVTDGNMGYFYDEVYTLNGKWDILFEGNYNDWDKENGELSYYINDQEQSETDYKSNLNKIFDESRAKEPTFEMDDKELIIFLTGDEELAEKELSKRIINISINGVGQFVDWEDNESVEALKDLIAEKGSLTLKMFMYGDFEEVGSIGASLPSNDAQITTEPGDIVLYNSNQLVVFYGSNTWAYTKLGKLKASQEVLSEMLANGDVEIFLTISQ